jgi:hypothetical protein
MDGVTDGMWRDRWSTEARAYINQKSFPGADLALFLIDQKQVYFYR